MNEQMRQQLYMLANNLRKCSDAEDRRLGQSLIHLLDIHGGQDMTRIENWLGQHAWQLKQVRAMYEARQDQVCES